MKTALVLEGGALRGMYTAGVLDIFMDENILPDAIVGVSAGASFGVNLLSRQRGRVIRYNKRFIQNKKYMSLGNLLREGNLFSTDFAYGTVPRELDPFDDATFMQSSIPYYVVVSNMEEGKAEYIQLHSIFAQIDLLRASSSLPFISRPVNLEGKLYVDGGIFDSIPYAWALRQGYEKLIVILTRPAGYRKKPLHPLLACTYQKKYPKLAEGLRNRHLQYNQALDGLAQLEQEGKAFLLRPSQALAIDRIEKDPEKLQAAYDRGLFDAKKHMPQLLSFLQT